MQERRKFVRIWESSQISYQIMPNMKAGDYLTRDLSQGGLRFFVHEFIPLNTLLKIRINLEKKYFAIEAVVKIVWIKEIPMSERFEIGVEFVNIPAETSSLLIDYIKDNLRPPRLL
ncbi:MAG: PilZ domain-containing protein [Candidatus Omnitrophota bacterium]|nr:PilZ domain-containing protein [Candidatus Omnitrophota bacterium]